MFATRRDRPTEEGRAAATTEAEAARPPEGSPDAARRYVPALDGLRAVAVFAVMGFHAGVPGMRIGEFGVDLFFALSGFLITEILLAEFDRTGSIKFRFFYARRFLRLMPAYLLYAAFITALLLGAHRPFVAQEGWTRPSFLRALWLYFFNYVPLGGLWSLQPLTSHLWSLSVEEQFYFIWPGLLFVAARLRRSVSVAWGCSLALVLHHWFVDPAGGHLLLTDRGLGLAIGSAVAATINRKDFWRFRALLGIRTIRSAVLVATAAALVICSRSEHPTQSPLLPAVSLLFALVVAMIWVRQDDWLCRRLSRRPIVYIGKISYGVYLYHMVAHVLTWDLLLHDLPHWPRAVKFGVRLLFFGALSVLLASASYRLYEAPFLRLKDRFRARPVRRA